MTTYNQNPKEILQGIVERQDADALHDWIKFYLKFDIPRVAVSGHSSPFDFVADFIFNKITTAVVLANRSGGKTLNFGILNTVVSYLHDDVEIATIGAIQQQAKKGYEYFGNFVEQHPFGHNLEKKTMNRTSLLNKSSVQIITGTMSGVNSPHPQVAFFDEVDLMAWNILQQGFSMPQSKDHYPSKTILTSTRKFAGGVMQRLLNEAEERNAKTYRWNIWDVVKPLPKDNPELMKEILDTFGSDLPDDIDQADGYYSWNDLLAKYALLDRETWETEWLCSRPGLEGVIYGTSYEDEENLIVGWEPPREGRIYLLEDFGFGEGHPDVILFAWMPPENDRMVIFDELYLTGMGLEDIWTEIDQKLREYGHHLPDRAKRRQASFTGWIGDPHGHTEIEDRRKKLAPMMEKHEDAGRYIVVDGIKLVKRLFESGRLMITDKCPQLRTELLSYKKKKNADGTFSNLPEKKYDHGPDALRYGVIRLIDLIDGAVSSRIDRENKVVKAVEPRKERVRTPAREKPITAGLLDQEY